MIGSDEDVQCTVRDGQQTRHVCSAVCRVQSEGEGGVQTP